METCYTKGSFVGTYKYCCFSLLLLIREEGCFHSWQSELNIQELYCIL